MTQTVAVDHGAIVERLLRMSACEVSDALSTIGLRPHGLPGIAALEPASRIAGPAYTVRFTRDPWTKRIDMFEHVKPGDVMVLANGGDEEVSLWGGLRTTAAQERGAVASVIYGAYRDIDEHRELGYPVFGCARTIVGGSSIRINPVAVNEPVLIGSTEVRPGDYVVGDASGVVVIPQERVLEVVEAGEAVLIRDEAKRESLRAGGTLP